MVMTVLIILTFDHKTFTNAWHNVVSIKQKQILLTKSHTFYTFYL